MPSTILEIANAIKNLNDSKWHCHIQYFVSKIGISPEVADSSPNDNILGLRYSIVGDGARSVHEITFAEPSPIVVGHPGTYFQIGKLSKQKKLITVSIQREIVQYIIGTHRELLKHYPKTAESRQETWRSWIDDGASANHYQQIHLPYIVTYFKDVWDTKFKIGVPLTPSILHYDILSRISRIRR
mmetsp:Transcript_18492/g.44515  ORF Transcript_18492/g.44515 Transcript_18492/m.44515 type:complete len:185 (-) Transcript_18492:17-571(-)